VQLHLLAVVGHGKRRRLAGGFPGVIAAGDEVAIVVIAFKEAIEVVIHLSLGAGGILGRIQRGLGFLYFGRFLRFGYSVFFLRLSERVVVSGLQFSLADLVHISEGIRHDFQQVGGDEVVHFGTLCVHDAVKAEIKIRLVELEQLGKLLQQATAKLFGAGHISGSPSSIAVARLVPRKSRPAVGAVSVRSATLLVKPLSRKNPKACSTSTTNVAESGCFIFSMRNVNIHPAATRECPFKTSPTSPLGRMYTYLTSSLIRASMSRSFVSATMEGLG